MGMEFGSEKWEKTKETYRLWWEGKLGRPILPVILGGKDPGREEPSAPLLSQANCLDFSICPEDIIDRFDYELSRQVYLGDAFPSVTLHQFGPGVVAAFLGAEMDNHTGNVWFHPREHKEIADIHFRFDPEHSVFRRIRDLYAAGMERWEGQVLMGMTDLGGSLDILSSFRPGEKLLVDLVMAPDEVKRLLREAHEAWHQYYEAFNRVLQPVNPGYSAWDGLYCEDPYYMLQCDFCYMIGPEMFGEFVLPELKASVARVSRAFYHLDGPGAVTHLDQILGIDDLDGVQWVPAPADLPKGHMIWRDLFRRIHGGGKKLQLQAFHGFEEIDAVIEMLDGDAGSIHHCPFGGGMDQLDYFQSRLSDYEVLV